MALTASIDTREPSRSTLHRVLDSACGSNDAFSFWKLPQDWKAALDREIAESKAVAEHYLFEEYLSREDRQPPSQDAGLLCDQESDSGRRPSSAELRCDQDAREARIPAMAMRKRAHRLLARLAANQPALLEDDRRVAHRILARRNEILHRADPRRRKPARNEPDGADGGSRGTLQFPLLVEPAAGAISRSIGTWSTGSASAASNSAPTDCRMTAVCSAARATSASSRLCSRSGRATHGLNGFRAPSTLRRAEWITQALVRF